MNLIVFSKFMHNEASKRVPDDCKNDEIVPNFNLVMKFPQRTDSKFSKSH